LLGISGALTFYYALLGSLTLGLAILASNWSSGGKLLRLTLDQGQLLQGWGPSAKRVMLRRSTLQALAALSPILANLVAHPLLNNSPPG
jgi:hypothetical protein